MCLCGGLTLASSKVATQPLTYSLPPSRISGRIGRGKMRKLVHQAKGRLITEGKRRKTHKWQKATMHHLPQTEQHPNILWIMPMSGLHLFRSGQHIRLDPFSVTCALQGCLLNRVWGEWEKEKMLVLCKHCSATIRMLPCYPHWFSHMSKTQHHAGCCEES